MFDSLRRNGGCAALLVTGAVTLVCRPTASGQTYVSTCRTSGATTAYVRYGPTYVSDAVLYAGGASAVVSYSPAYYQPVYRSEPVVYTVPTAPRRVEYVEPAVTRFAVTYSSPRSYYRRIYVPRHRYYSPTHRVYAGGHYGHRYVRHYGYGGYLRPHRSLHFATYGRHRSSGFHLSVGGLHVGRHRHGGFAYYRRH